MELAVGHHFDAFQTIGGGVGGQGLAVHGEGGSVEHLDGASLEGFFQLGNLLGCLLYTSRCV